MHSLIKTTRSSSRPWRPRRGRSTAVRYTLLAPPSRLTIDEAAALLHLPRRAVESELEWLVPAAGEVSEGVIVREHPALYA
jgi:hypothetical protein